MENSDTVCNKKAKQVCTEEVPGVSFFHSPPNSLNSPELECTFQAWPSLVYEQN